MGKIMKIDALIKEKIKVQRKLTREANYDIRQYCSNVDEFISKYEKKHGKSKYYKHPTGWSPPSIKLPLD